MQPLPNARQPIQFQHTMEYTYGGPAKLSLHEFRLKALSTQNQVHTQTFKLDPIPHRLWTKMDPFGNEVFVATFPEKTDRLAIVNTIKLDLAGGNPFDFVIPKSLAQYPFEYTVALRKQLAPFLEKEPSCLMDKFLKNGTSTDTIGLITQVNQRIHDMLSYQIRHAPGIQTIDETLSTLRGTCRDYAWLLVQALRYLGFAARFASGYLVQAFQKTMQDNVEFHAWAQVYLPGAGWIGLDATSGLLASNGHILLCANADPALTEPIEGQVDAIDSNLSYRFSVDRMATHAEADTDIEPLAAQVDQYFKEKQLILTQGAEPTFISKENESESEWQIAALGEEKHEKSQALMQRLRTAFLGASGWVDECHGKHYPNEFYPRWACHAYWCKTKEDKRDFSCFKLSSEIQKTYTLEKAKQLMSILASRLNHTLLEAFEDYNYFNWKQGLQNITEAPVGYVIRLEHTDKPNKIVLFPTEGPLHKRIVLSDQPICFAAEVRAGILYIALPQTEQMSDYLYYLALLADICEAFGFDIVLEGYAPPITSDYMHFSITPDPGVLEVNIHYAENWADIQKNNQIVFESAQALGLTSVRTALSPFQFNGTGGGCHLTLGGVSPKESLFFKRPDILRSMICFWQHHPSLSYLFGGQFVGASSQAPRIDETSGEIFYQLENALKAIKSDQPLAPEALNALLSHCLTDMTGNAHRAEFCIDKLYSKERKLGLLELRGFEMPETADQLDVLQLLVRTLVARFHRQPYLLDFIRHGTQLHDRFLLSTDVRADFNLVLNDLNTFGYAFEMDWFDPFFARKFPQIGAVQLGEMHFKLFKAIEIWPVIGEEMASQAQSRTVDNSSERLEMVITAFEPARFVVTCNGYKLPLLCHTDMHYYCGIRFKARSVPVSVHSYLDVQFPLEFKVYDQLERRLVSAFSLNSEFELIEAPLTEEVFSFKVLQSPEFPTTLDLRRSRS